MRKIFLIAHSNIRNAKGQSAAIVVLILIAALMLNLWLMLSTDYRANFERCHDRLNAEHVTLTVDDDGEIGGFLGQFLEKDDRVAQYRLDSCMHRNGTFSYNGGSMNSWFVFLDKETALTRDVGKMEVVEEGTFASGVYLPMLYKTEEIAIGKPIEISIGSKKMVYTVCGFFNSAMMGSHNCTIMEIVLTQDQYAKLEEKGYAPRAVLCSVRLNDQSINLNYEAELKAAAGEYRPNMNMVGSCYDIIIQSRYISQMICSGILSAMAFFVLLIALIVIVSNIINYIQVNMKNLGALKAAGYTSRQLVGSLLLQFLELALLAAVLGAGLSYCVFPGVNAMMAAQTGIPYQVHFLPLPFAGSLGGMCGAVALAVWYGAHRIKRIEPVTALRMGVRTHSFRRNHVPLEKPGAPLSLALALKTMFSGMKYNVTVCITMLVLSLIVVFSGLMVENVIKDMSPFVNMIMGEMADSCINIRVEAEEDFLSGMSGDPRVEKAYPYNSQQVSHLGGAELLATFCDDFSKVNNQEVVFEGRFPQYDNEIAIGAKYAREKGLGMGEEIEITANGERAKYLICGFTQISNNLGRDCLLTRGGYERLGMPEMISYYVNLAEGTDIDAFHREMEEKFPGSVNATLNLSEIIEAMGGVYVSLIKIIVAAILALSAVIILFVLYLLVRTLLNDKKRDYGIMKALGFTTGQLVLQTALSFMPATILSAIVGLTLCSFIINPLTALFLSGIGMVKCTFTVPAGFITAAGAGLVLYAFAVVCVLSMKIKRIAPRALLAGD